MLLPTQKQEALSLPEIARLAPAAFTQQAAPETSDRYGFVSTLDAISIMADYGYAPYSATQTVSKKKHLVPFADHMLRFRKTTDIGHYTKNVPEIILINGHSGKKALSIGTGVFRFACANGLLVADKGQQTTLRHTHLTATGFENLLRTQTKNLPKAMHNIQAMDNKVLSDDEALEFAYNATKLRWEIIDGYRPPNWDTLDSKAYAVLEHSVPSLLNIYRPQDKDQTLYNVFNRCQEKIIRGGLPILSVNSKTKRSRWRNSSGVRSIDQTVKLNKTLWTMAHNHLGGTV